MTKRWQRKKNGNSTRKKYKGGLNDDVLNPILDKSAGVAPATTAARSTAATSYINGITDNAKAKIAEAKSEEAAAEADAKTKEEEAAKKSAEEEAEEEADADADADAAKLAEDDDINQLVPNNSSFENGTKGSVTANYEIMRNGDVTIKDVKKAEAVAEATSKFVGGGRRTKSRRSHRKKKSKNSHNRKKKSKKRGGQ